MIAAAVHLFSSGIQELNSSNEYRANCIQGHSERGHSRNEYRYHYAWARLHRKRHQRFGKFLLPRFRAVDPRTLDFRLGILCDRNRVMVRTARLDHAHLGDDRCRTIPGLRTLPMHNVSTVDIDRLPCDMCAAGTGQEVNHVGNVFGRLPFLQRNNRFYLSARPLVVVELVGL